eukprot:924744-Amphidinium_carterae.1
MAAQCCLNGPVHIHCLFYGTCLQTEVRFQGHVDSTPPDHVGACTNLTETLANLTCSAGTAWKPS